MMTWNNILTVWSGSLWVFYLFWGALAVILLYLARSRAHELLYAVSRALGRWLRMAARALSLVRVRLLGLHRTLIAAMAQDQAERRIERSFHRLAHAVESDLDAFPQLQRRLTDQIERIERDYDESADTPPIPPQWLEAVDAIARTQSAGDSSVAGILDAMHGTLTRATHDALDEFRFSSRKRHGLLRRMLPYWRRAARMLARMNNDVASIARRAESVDAMIVGYEGLRDSPPVLSLGVRTSYWMRCLVALVVLALLAVAVVAEHSLLQVPLQRLLPGVSGVFGFPLADIESWGLIGAEVGFGALLLEVNRTTRLFPALGVLERRTRVRAGALLTLLWIATVAFAGSLVVLDAPVGIELGRSVAQVGGVVLLSVLLLPTAIALEMALSMGRGVLMDLVSGFLALSSLALRAASWLMRLAGRVSIYAYDVVIFLPLAIEALLAVRRRRKAAERENSADSEETAVATVEKATETVKASEAEKAPAPEAMTQ